MKKLSLLTIILFSCASFAQIKFEKGYFINNSGEKSEVLIKNLDWKNNPIEFEYKLDDSSKSIKEDISNVQEFAINDGDKYVRQTVMIDRSSNDLKFLSQTREPKFEKNEVFLKYLVEGKASLLYYENGNLRRFFFTSNTDEVKQLVYKSYYINQSQIAYNEDFKKQLAEVLNCGIDNKEIQILNYNAKSLTKIFNKNSQCLTGSSISYTDKKEKQDVFNLTITPGISMSSFQINNLNYPSEETKFDKKFSFRIGAEFEYVLPFNKNKWSLFIEPTYQYYKDEKESTTFYTGTPVERHLQHSIDYKYIEIPLGIRHYFFLNNQSRLFLNAAYVTNINLNSTFKSGYYTTDTVSTQGNFMIGAGYKYNKLSAEFRIATSKDILGNYLSARSHFNSVSLILGYTIL
ncbi:outer membrane beta-barrel protein [Chryseobacterium sp. SIMBA_038]|uniref:outer membrane beta-barrel protein n=3 Tax=Pseudomonadati TaxID=3379134 RepID=UPI00397E1DBC